LRGLKFPMSFVVIAAVFYVTLAGGMFIMQRKLLYPGSGDKPNIEHASFDHLIEVFTNPEPGLHLTHWFHPPQNDELPVIVMFHGNAGHIGDRVPKMRPLLEAGFGLILTGYRGYGGNPGKPSEEGLSADARSVLDWVQAQGVPADRIVLYGESLGTAVAVKMAEERDVAAVVLEAPPSSVVDVAQSVYWFLPVRFLLLDQWDSKGRVQRIGAPLMILHGERDKVVPARFGQRLYEAAVNPKELLLWPQGEHTDLLEYGPVVERVLGFIRRYAPAA